MFKKFIIFIAVIGFVPGSIFATESVLFQDNGKVGIGTAYPKALTEISGLASPVKFTAGPKPNTTLLLQNNSFEKGTGPSIVFGSYYGYINTVALATIAAERELGNNWSASAGRGSLVFSTTSKSLTHVERMRIDSAGNVGVGTKSPDEKLTIEGNIKLSKSDGSIIFSDGSVMTSASTDGARYSTVNIGTGSVYNNFIIEHAKEKNGYNESVSFYPKTMPGQGTASHLTHFKTPSHSTGRTKHYVAVDGALGVGTLHPKVDIHAINTAETLIRAENKDTGNSISLYQQATDSYLMVKKGATGSASSFRLYTNGTEKLKVTPDGNLNMLVGGIKFKDGTVQTSASNSLDQFSLPDVKQTEIGRIFMGRLNNAYSYTGYNMQMSAYNSEWKYVYNSEASGMHYRRGGIDFITAPRGNAGDIISHNVRMKLTQTGNLGIGTSAPLVNLHVVDSGETTIRAENKDTGNAISLYQQAKESYLTVSKGASGQAASLTFRTNGGNKVRITPDGNLNMLEGGIKFKDGSVQTSAAEGTSLGPIKISEDGKKVAIGTDTFASGIAFSVNGAIKARDIAISQSGWADYVFDSDYELMPLKEVDQFIKKNNHLPEIPSEKEVLENGILQGEFNVQLLKKIEELTLYVIQLEKRLDVLENQN